MPETKNPHLLIKDCKKLLQENLEIIKKCTCPVCQTIQKIIKEQIKALKIHKKTLEEIEQETKIGPEHLGQKITIGFATQYFTQTLSGFADIMYSAHQGFAFIEEQTYKIAVKKTVETLTGQNVELPDIKLSKVTNKNMN
jgi:hydrogenase maturation factor